MERSQEEKKKTTSHNPATGEIIGTSTLHNVSDVENCLQQSRKAQKSWAALPIKERAKHIIKIRDYLSHNVDEIVTTIAQDNGKIRMDAYVAEVLPTAMAISYYCKNAKTFLHDQKLSMGNLFTFNKRSEVIRVPYGVIGIISPWNYPFSIAFSEIVMGLLAGNGVILKTASRTQMVGLEIIKAIEAAKLPDGLFQYVNLPGREAGDAFLNAGVDKLFFTGSVPVGKLLMKKAANTLTPVCLELGGNDAMIICEDADLNRAVSGTLWAGFSNCGQSCGGIERIYVHQDIYDEYIHLLKKEVEKLRVGYDTDYNVDMGAMTTSSQIKLVTSHIEDAQQKGAQIWAQSNIPDKQGLHNFLPATVLTDVNHTMDVMKFESFGPVIGVMKVDDIDQAITLANDSNLGLTGSMWSKNRKKARRIARKIQAGTVTINDHLMSHGLPESAWGGFKESGIGRSHGELGMLEMTQPQMIVDDILSFTKKNLWWHPYDETVYNGLKGIMKTLYGTTFSSKVSGLVNVVKILPRLFKS